MDAAVEKFFQEHNAIPSSKAIRAKSPSGVDCISATKKWCMALPGRGKLKKGSRHIDTGCKVNRWCAHGGGELCPVGKASPRFSVAGRTKGRWIWPFTKWALSDFERSGCGNGEMVKKAGFCVVENFWETESAAKCTKNRRCQLCQPFKSLRRPRWTRNTTGLVIALEPEVKHGDQEGGWACPNHWTQVKKDRLPSAHFSTQLPD